MKTDHRIGDTVKTNIKYQYFEKDYDTASFDHKGFFVRNGWDFEALDSKVHRAWWGIDLEHKQVEYNLLPDREYTKETVEIKGNCKRKENYKGSTAELETQVTIAKELGYITGKVEAELLENSNHIIRMLQNLKKSLS